MRKRKGFKRRALTLLLALSMVMTMMPTAALTAAYGDTGTANGEIGSDAVTKSIYVSSEGNNDHPGTESQPVRTLKKAFELAKAADDDTDIANITIYVKKAESADIPDLWIGSALKLEASKPVTLTTAQGSESAAVIKRADDFTGGPGQGAGHLISVGSGVSLTLKNITLDGNAGVSAYHSIIVAEGSLTMEDGAELQNNKIQNQGGSGGGILVQNGSFTMNGGTISGNTGASGGGVSVEGESGSFTMNGGTISGNTAQTGGGVYISSVSTFTMTGGNISDNRAEYAGGVYVSGVGKAGFSGDVRITGNALTSGSRSNVFLENGARIMINGPLAETAHMGISTKAKPTGTETARLTETADYSIQESDISKIIPDSSDYSVKIERNNLFLYVSPIKNIYVSSSGNDAALGTENNPVQTVNKAVELAAAVTETGAEKIRICVMGDGNLSTADTTISEAITIENTSKPIILTTAPKAQETAMIKRGSTDYLFKIQSGGSLTVENIIMDGGNLSDVTGLVLMNQSSASFTMNSGSVLQNNAGGIHISSGSLTMNGGTISGNEASQYGGGVHLAGGSFTMNGGTISGNEASQYGGGVYLMGGIFTMNGGTISGNKAAYGGGVAMCVPEFTEFNGGVFTMTGGSISGNTASQDGGGVYVKKGFFYLLGAARIIGNAKTDSTANNVKLLNGNTIFIAGSLTGEAAVGVSTEVLPAGGLTVNIARGVSGTDGYTVTDSDRVKFTSDSDGYTVKKGVGNNLQLAVEAARVIYVSSTGNDNGADGSREKPTATLGKAFQLAKNATAEEVKIYVLKGKDAAQVLTVGTTAVLDATKPITLATAPGETSAAEIKRGSSFTSNLITVTAGSTLTLENIIVDGNKTAVSDGADSLVKVTGGTFIINSGAALQNNANSSGGGGVSVTGGSLILNGGTLSGNTAKTYGGGVYASGSGVTVTMNGGTISGNTASQNGGGVYVNSSTFNMSGGTINGNTATQSGGGIYANGATQVSGGTVSGNTAKFGGGIYATGSDNNLIMSGGTVSGNTATQSGGGVYVNSGFSLSGAPQIKGNTQKGSASNVLLGNDKTVTLTGALTGENPIGISTSVIPGDIEPIDIVTSGSAYTITDADRSCFASDSDAYIIIKSGDKLRLSRALAAIFVDSSAGDDSKAGTKEEPVRTLKRAFELASAVNDTAIKEVKIFVAGDSSGAAPALTLGEGVTFTGNTASKPVTLASAQGNTAVVQRGSGFRGNLITVKGGSLILENIIIDGNKGAVPDATGSLVMVEKGSCTINAGAILKDNSMGNSYSGGGAYAAGGTFTIAGGTISGNQGNGVYIRGGQAAMSGGGTISGNTSGGVNIYSGSFTMSGGTIRDNTAGLGGGVNVSSDGTFNMSGGTISGNTASYSGGGVYLSGGTVAMDGGTISGNTGHGGGVYLHSGTFTMDGGTINGNRGHGGGVYLYGGTLNLSGAAVIKDNTYNDTANNVWLFSGRTITLTGALAGTASIGVDTDSTVAEGKPADVAAPSGSYVITDDDLARFNADESGRETVLEDGKIKLKLKIQEITVPAPVSGIIYNGGEQTGVPEGVGYTLKGHKETNAGSYTATATLKEGYAWADVEDARSPQEIKWTIGQKTLNVIPGSKQRAKYMEAIPELTYTFSGEVSGETPGFTGNVRTEAKKGSDAGTYPITKGDLALANNGSFRAGNYTLEVAEGVYFTIDKADQEALSINEITGAVVYGDTVTLSTEGGSGNGAVAYSLVSGSGKFNGSEFKITGAGSITVKAVKAADNNYNKAATVYTFTAGKKPVTVTGVTVAEKGYDGKTTAAIISGGEVAGRVDGDDVIVSTTNAKAVFADKNAGESKDVTVTGLHLEGTTAENYELSAQPIIIKGSIKKKPLTIRIDSKVSKVGEKLEELTYSHTGLAEGDTITGTPETEAKNNAAAQYHITPGSIAVNDGNGGGNYEITFENGTYTVTAKNVQTIAFEGDTVSKTYGDESFTNAASKTAGNGAITYRSENTAVAEVNETTGKVTILKAGEAKIVATAAETTDYAKGTATYTLIVKRKPVTIEGITASDKKYDGTTKAAVTGGIIVGNIDGNALTIVEGSASFADKNVGNNKEVTFRDYALGGAAKDNYILECQPAPVRASIRAIIVPEEVKNAVKGYTGTYDEQAHNAVIIDAERTAGYIIRFSADGENGEYSDVNPQVTNVPDSKTVWAAISREGYETVKKSVEATVNKAEWTETAASGKAKYGTSSSVDLSPYIAAGGKLETPSVIEDAQRILSGTGGSLTENILNFAIVNDSAKAEKTAKYAVPVKDSRNYNDYEIIVTITALDKAPQNIRFNESSKTVTYGAADFINKATGPDGGGEITYRSENPEVATVDETTGKVTIHKAGQAKIVATATETDDYRVGTAEYLLTVNNKPAPSAGGGGGAAPAAQKPTIEAGEGIKVTLSADGTTATITAQEGYEIADVTLNGVSKGAVTKVSGLKTGDRLVVTAAKKEASLTEEEQKKADTITGFKLIAKSKQTKLKNGKKAIRITWNTSEYKFDGVEVWRSTKRNSGYGKKPMWIIKAKNTKYYYNTAIKKGKTYYYKLRGYVVIKGQKYYTPFSTKAYRKVR